MSYDDAIEIKNVSKVFQTYANPADRLKQIIANRIPLNFGTRKQYYKEFHALSGINATIKKGEKVGIIGRNGSGKSTLLQLIAGTLTPSDGKITRRGRVAALLELGSGFNPEFTGRENISINASVLGLSSNEIRAKLSSIIDFADIGDYIDQPVKTYSSGMFVRLAFAVIAHVNADVLIIDEALAVGDAFFNQKCMRFMNEFAKTGTILLVTHDTATVTGFCDRAIWIDKGHLVADGNTKDVAEQYLASIYGSKEFESGKTTEVPPTKETVDDFIDIRSRICNDSTLRNDLEIFKFNHASKGFGLGDAEFINVILTDELGKPLSWTVGGELVHLKIRISIQKRILKTIVGFSVKNNLGQTLFGENTFLYPGPIKVDPGEILESTFTFRMPIMPSGDYVISVAIADGTQDDHQMLKWLHDALLFKSHSSSISTGLLGIPIKDITINTRSSK